MNNLNCAMISNELILYLITLINDLPISKYEWEIEPNAACMCKSCNLPAAVQTAP